MAFGLTIGTERALALQNSIQDELTKRGYSPDADPVMAEYITIMIINNKAAAQVTTELEDLIGSDYDHTFTDWLFAEAAKGALESETPSQPPPPVSLPTPQEQNISHDPPPHLPAESRRPPQAPRNSSAPLYQQAISQVLPVSPSAQKRTASARSPSPSGHGPNKSRRTDLPTGPRAMLRGSDNHASQRTLLERVGGPARNGGNFAHDDIQARIDNITNNSPDPNMMIPQGFPNGMPMEMNPMAAGIANPLMLQEMMMNQMAMMAQMASSMGMINPGFPMQGGMPGDMNMYPGGGMNGFQGQHHAGGGSRGRGNGRPIRGRGRGAPPLPNGSGPINSDAPQVLTEVQQLAPVAASTSNSAPAEPSKAVAAASNIVAPIPTPAPAATQTRTGYVPPERPQSPTLCKFGLKCTNALCRYSHPSPVATPESGVVLSNEACDKGKDCKDKDCIKAHVSPATLLPISEQLRPSGSNMPSITAPSPAHTPNSVPCRFGAACTRPNCPYLHPTPQPSHKIPNTHFAQQCRFGAGCTRASCPFQHPEGRVLPTSFHRGLSTNAPIVSVPTPEAGSMGGPSHNRSMIFNKKVSEGTTKDALEKQMKEIEEKKSQAQRAVAEAEAAASKKDESKPVAITV